MNGFQITLFGGRSIDRIGCLISEKYPDWKHISFLTIAEEDEDPDNYIPNLK